MITDRLGGGGAQRAAASVFGRGLAGLFGAVGRLRPSDKPLHPRGAVVPATITRFGLSPECGVPWLDETGTDDVLVRVSRATGLPAPLPDVLGLAIRIPFGDQHADLLLSSTGRSALGRYLLAPVRSAREATFSTLLPYRTPTGPALIAATPAQSVGGLDFDLRVAAPRGAWRRFGRLEIEPDSAADRGHGRDDHISFDAMANTVPGLNPPDWVRRLRQPSYRAARRTRGDLRKAP